MSMLTPSATSAVFSGFGISALFWLFVLEMDKLPFIGRFISRDKVLMRINQKKTLAFATTEAANIAVHGVSSPLSVLAAVGCTIVNGTFIWAVAPLMLKRSHVKARTAKMPPRISMS